MDLEIRWTTGPWSTASKPAWINSVARRTSRRMCDGLQLLLPKRPASRAAVDIVAHAVELQIQRVQARLPAAVGELPAAIDYVLDFGALGLSGAIVHRP